jgi:glycosyltransferase involved in cell wall biosynthesis
LKPVEVLVIDSDSEDGTAQLAANLGCCVYSIPRREFDHGGTRNYGVSRASGDILVFLTQDALPKNPEFLQRLTAPIRDGRAAAAYARQIAAPDANPREVFTRLYNYPPESCLRHITTIQHRTLRSFFFSNAASAFSRASFDSVGQFPAPVPAYEDLILCARLLNAGHYVAYVADAEVVHSHRLTLRETYRRYAGAGLIAKDHHNTLRCASSSGDGFTFTRQQVRYLLRVGRPELIPAAIAEAGVKAFAYCFGSMFPGAHRQVGAG